MTTPRRKFLGTAIAALATSGLSLRAVSEPNALKLVYPFAAGGSGDAVARLLAEQLARGLGRPALVTNVTGAGGQIGARTVKGAPPDGATLLFAAAAQMTLQPHIMPGLGYDPERDFVPIGQIARFDQVVTVSRTIPVSSLHELVDWLRANPDKAAFGSPGTGTGPHLAGLAIGRTFNIELRHVAYRGTPQALPDILQGRLPVFIAARAELSQHHDSGALRILVSTDAERPNREPNVPTLRESGVAMDAPAWFGVYAPIGTQREIVEGIAKITATALQTSEVHARIAALGFDATVTTGDELRSIQRAQSERWRALVARLAFKLE